MWDANKICLDIFKPKALKYFTFIFIIIITIGDEQASPRSISANSRYKSQIKILLVIPIWMAFMGQQKFANATRTSI